MKAESGLSSLPTVFNFKTNSLKHSQLTFPCLKSTIETLKKSVKYVQSQQFYC